MRNIMEKTKRTLAMIIALALVLTGMSLTDLATTRVEAATRTVTIGSGDNAYEIQVPSIVYSSRIPADPSSVDPIKITSSCETLTTGWYVVTQDTTYSGNMQFNGTNNSDSVNIILLDGVTLTVNQMTRINSGSADYVRLTIWGQSQGTGKLVIKNGFKDTTDNGTLEVNGGILQANNEGGSGDAISCHGVDAFGGRIEAKKSISTTSLSVCDGAVCADGGGIYCVNVIIDSGSITTNCGLTVQGGYFQMQGGTVKCSYQNDYDPGYGIYIWSNGDPDSGTLEFSGGDLEAYGDCAAIYAGGDVFYDVTYYLYAGTTAPGEAQSADDDFRWMVAPNYVRISQKPVPAASDFTFTAPASLVCDGQTKAAVLAAKSTVTGMGTVTVNYYSDAACTVAATPNAVGTYYVAATVAEGSGYAGATKLTDSTWLFTIYPPVTGVTLNKTETSLKIGETDQLTASVAPADTNQSVTWSSDNESVASVDASGKVSAKKAGTATITVKTADGNKTASCTVTVKKLDATVTAPEAVNSLTYTGSAQELVTAGSTSDGTLLYSLTRDGSYSAEIPKAVNAGTYDVYYKVVGDENHSDKLCESPVRVTIARTQYSGTKSTTAYVYAGYALRNEVTLPAIPANMAYGQATTSVSAFSGLSVKDGKLSFQSDASLLAGQTYKITVPVTCETGANYDPYTITVVFTAKTCEHSATSLHEETDATCTEAGSHMYYTCDECGVQLDQNGNVITDESQLVIPAKGHSYGEWRSNGDATAYADGTKTRICKVCGDKETVRDEGSKLEFGQIKKPEDKQENNYGKGGLSGSAEEIQNAVLTDEDKAAMALGKDVSVWMEVKDQSSTVSVSDRTAVENCLPDGFYVGTYLEINLWKQIEDSDATQVTETPNGKVKVSITLPETLRSNGRTYKVVRIHNGVATLLDATVDENYVLTFETDRFSTYALIYEDSSAENGSDNSGNQGSGNPNTGDSDSFRIWTLVLLCGLFIVMIAVRAGLDCKNRRRK